jgi:hypothetical protein
MQRSSLSSLGVSSINLSSLALQDTANASNTSSATLTLNRGWGSTESRTACMSLDTLAGAQSAGEYQHPSLHRTITPPTDNDMEVDSWGFFIDVPGEDENAPGLSW